jgi:crotonobetainyl-CoA:carnitine CoA-transferase CaiB-like acyl-CoA transferase
VRHRALVPLLEDACASARARLAGRAGGGQGALRLDQLHRRGVRRPAGAGARRRRALPHPLTPELRLVASPMKLSATPVRYRHAPPLLGQHSDELLRKPAVRGRNHDLAAGGVIA